MKIGQMSIRGKLSELADYMQLDISGLTADLVMDKYIKYYNLNNQQPIPVILHGDWQKNGASENNILDRVNEYIEIFHRLQSITDVIGITIHPPFRRKVDWDNFVGCCEYLENNGLNVFVENRSNNRIYLSTPEEIIAFSKNRTMTIDIPQLFISCGYDNVTMSDVLEKINVKNVNEVHLANVKKDGKHTFVGRKLSDGIISSNNIYKLLREDRYITLEILGGNNMFQEQLEEIKTYTSRFCLEN